MQRFLAALAAIVLVGGCAGGAPSDRAAGGIELAAAQVSRVTTTPDDATAGAHAINAFGLDLYAGLAGAGETGNLVFSPSSVALALSMARAGARGQSADEMDAVMRALGSDEHAARVAALDESLNARTATFQDAMGDQQEVTLRVVNAPFAQRGLVLEQTFLDALSARLDAGLRLVDFKAAPEDARRAVNAWVADQTEDRIAELLGEGSVDTMTRLALVNAIYLKAAWHTPFTEDATAPAPFTTSDGRAVGVPMMHGGGFLDYAAGDSWQAVDLPYVGRQLSMLVIVPDDLSAFEAGLDDTALDEIVGALRGREVILGLPKFGTKSQLELNDVLASLGMPTAFTDAADFSGITTEEPLKISAVIHQANIDVDEKGTEAAAATAVMITASGMPSDVVTLTVDRPFLFALRDVPSGAVLFLGRIADPSAP